MKKTIILLAIFMTTSIFGQTTSIPDTNFEQALIDLALDDVIDGSVLTANINTVTYLDLNGKNIADLTGIEDFLLLNYLDCSNNQLISVDVSNNSSLESFYCNNNLLTSLETGNINLITLVCNSNLLDYINVSNNILLQFLVCNDNLLFSLNVSNISSLGHLNASNNKLRSLNVKNSNNTNFSLFNVTNNPDLTCILVDNAVWSSTNWTNIDVSASFNDVYCPTWTYVPDDNFEQALIDLGYDTAPLDNYIPTANINTITSLSVSSKNISDLTGIEDFTTLEQLYAISNNLTSLNLSQNTALLFLNVNNNALTTLDISLNTLLTSLYCINNQLSILDVSQNTNLEFINFSANNISSIDLSNNQQLQTCDCSGNLLSTLNISQNTNLNILDFSNNQLTAIDVSNNNQLTELRFSNNQISSIDLSNNATLNLLYMPNNQLMGLDISFLSNVNFLNVQNNQLTSLNVRNGNNLNFTGFYATNNPNLTCINVDDAVYSTSNWTNIDVTASFNENCSLSVNQYGFENNFKIYPNPAKFYFSIQNNSFETIKNLTLYNMLGKIVYKTNSITNKIQISNLKKGVYLIQIGTNNALVSKIMIIE